MRDDLYQMRPSWNQAAFDYACQHMDCNLQRGAALPALVLDARKRHNAEMAVKTDSDGLQMPLLLVSSSDGGFEVVAKATSHDGPVLKPGDLVVWVPTDYVEAIGAQASDRRFGWIGSIPGTLKPVLDIEEGWRRGEKFLEAA